MRERFDKQGKLIIPLSEFRQGMPIGKNLFVVTEVYCLNGHNLIDKNHIINGFPGIRLGYQRPEQKGEFIISAIEGDFDKIILSGNLEKGKKDDLFCPICKVKLPVLVTCECIPGGELVVLGLTPKLDFNNSITFCNVTGCHNGSIIKSGEVINRTRLKAL